MSSPPLLLWLAGLALLAVVSAGPLGPLPNVTSLDLGLKDGTCAVGDVAYAAGEEVPGGAACERCRCEAGSVRCVRPRCEPRPGCKALHRPDHCCPTYQCECEQEGRVYSNGEKLVDPADPCRVCYCQGGEVVCRRIACFVRDDCTPRLVPGRCCPEYDNCPLRGVTTVAGVTPAMSTVEETPSSPAPTPPKETVKQEITIKEITPVSEIPVISNVKVQETLPSPGIEVPNYSSSKSPLIVREATTESFIASNSDSKPEVPAFIEILTPSSTAAEPSTASDKLSGNVELKITNDTPPSKISLSTQDSINSEIYSSSFATMGSPSLIPEVAVTATTKAPIVEEEDPSLFDHNPAFPPIPDDLSVVGNHDDEIAEQVADNNEHVPMIPEIITVSSLPQTASPSTIEPKAEEKLTTISLKTPDPMPTTLNEPTTSDYHSINDNIDNVKETKDTSFAFATTTEAPLKQVKDSPMLNLRSAIPTEILNVPSFVPEEINGEPDDVSESTTPAINIVASALPVTEQSDALEEKTSTSEAAIEDLTFKSVDIISTSSKLPEQPTITTVVTEMPTPESKVTEEPTTISKIKDVPTSTSKQLEQSKSSTSLFTIDAESDSVIDRESKIDTTINPSSTSSASEPTKEINEQKSSIVTEITAQTEFSSLPIETSDQNPQENSELIEKESAIASTADPSPADEATTKMVPSLEPEVITVSRAVPSSTGSQSFENIETTEFVLTPFGSSESPTDNVELIKISADPEPNAPIIEAAGTEEKKNNVLNDLINLVGDVAAIGDHTESPSAPHVKPTTTIISESDELIPFNAGYKSKNNNWNLNSITEIPLKNKNSAPITKQKVVEIEDDEMDSITDSPPPNDKVEPTTRRPIIDNVFDDGRADNNTDKKDIEIITKSYVPTISRRPTKVVMKKSGDDRPALTEVVSADAKDSKHLIVDNAPAAFLAKPIKSDLAPQSNLPTKEATSGQPASPAEPAEPELPTQPSQTSKPTLTELPAHSEQSTQPVQLKEPAQSAEPNQPAQAEESAQSVHSAQSSQPALSEQPVQSEQPEQLAQPAQIAQSSKPTQSEQTSQPVQSEQSTLSEQPAQPPLQSTQPELLASSTPAPAPESLTPQR